MKDPDRSITFEDLSLRDQLLLRIAELFFHRCHTFDGQRYRAVAQNAVHAGSEAGRILFNHDAELNAELRQICDGIRLLGSNSQGDELRQASIVSLELATYLLTRLPSGNIDLDPAIDRLHALSRALTELGEGAKPHPVLTPPKRSRGAPSKMAKERASMLGPDADDPTSKRAVRRNLEVRCCAAIRAIERTGTTINEKIFRDVQQKGEEAAHKYLGGRSDNRLSVQKIATWWKAHTRELRRRGDNPNVTEAEDSALRYGKALGWKACSQLLLSSLSAKNIIRPIADIASTEFRMPPVKDFRKIALEHAVSVQARANRQKK